MDYSIVIPAYNEETRIALYLVRIAEFMKGFSPEYEVIVVDDGSTDGTSEVVKRHMEENPAVKLINTPHKGKGFAVRTGVMKATGKYILMADADGATPIDELRRLSLWVKDHNFDIAIGSREGIGATRKREPFYRHLMGRIFNYFIQLVAVRGIKDTQCGFKLFKKDVARDIFARLALYGENAPEIKVPKVTAFDVEVLFVAKKLKYSIKEVPISWSYEANSKVHTFRDSINNLKDVMRVRINDLKGLYKV